MSERLCLVLAICLCLATAIYGQTGNATINGRVTDTTGAMIPNATVSVKNSETNVVRSAQSNAEGLYTIPNLIPGSYTITAQFAGMKNVEHSAIALSVGDRVSVDITMEVGAQTERVTVTAEAPLLRVDDVQSGLVIDTRRISELPQYNRNALAFALMTPNVNTVTSENQSHDSDFRINGGRTAQTEYFIDGVPVTTGYRHDIPASVPSMEAVGEFKVMTNGLSAEYGRLSGGAVTLVTRSGTNGLHGSAYEYFRNQALNANTWNANRLGSKKGVFHDNVFGFTVGGPVWIPKVYKGKDKTFFFLNFEGVRNSSGSNAATAGVPTALERKGDFSQSLIDQGKPVQIFNPTTGRLDAASRVVRDPFVGNVIPPGLINPLSKIYAGFYPDQNFAPQPGSSHDQNYKGSSRSFSGNNRWTGRLDQNWTSNSTSHFSITRFYSNSSSPRWLSPLQPVGGTWVDANTISLDHSWVLTPTTILNARVGVVRTTNMGGTSVAADSSGWGLQPLMLNLLGTTTLRVPSIGTGDSINTLGGGSSSNTFETNYSGSISVQKLWGKHTVKMGYDHRRYYVSLSSGGMVEMASSRNVTSQYFDTPTTGSGFASWLLGAVIWGDGTQFAGPASLQTYHGAYVQDDFKVNSKLTLNLGVRWDFEPPRTERFDRQIYWDERYRWPVKPTAGWSWESVMQAAGVANVPRPDWLVDGYSKGRVAVTGSKDYPGRIAQATFRRHFAPRVGVAWQFMPKTVLRAGYGMNWLTQTGGVFLNSATWNVGYGDFARFLQTGTPDNGLTFPLTFNNPMPNGVGYVPSPFLTRDVNAVNQSLLGSWFIANRWNQYPGFEHVVQFGVQREIGTGNRAWLIESYFNGNFGRKLPFWVGTSEHILPGAYYKLGPYGAALNIPVPNPVYGQVAPTLATGPAKLPFGRVNGRQPFWQEVWTMGDPLGTSNYYSGYVQAQHRFGQGFGVLANYTFSKMLQDVGGIDGQYPQGPSQQGFPQAGLGLKDIYGLASTDITHRVMFNFSLDVPVGKGRRWLGSPQNFAEKAANYAVGGWRLAGTATYRSGTPIMVTASGGSNWNNIGQGRTIRPVIVPGQSFGSTTNGHEALLGSANQKPYINNAAFRNPTGFEIGDVPSTFPNWRGPGFSQWDTSVLKDFPIQGEKRYLQVRFEAQNMLNHMNCGNPTGAINNINFGRVTGQSGSPRRIMIAAKLYF